MSSALVILWARSGVYRRGVRRARQELSAFAKVLDAPAKPVLAILGGAKAGLLQKHGAMETFDLQRAGYSQPHSNFTLQPANMHHGLLLSDQAPLIPDACLIAGR